MSNTTNNNVLLALFLALGIFVPCVRGSCRLVFKDCGSKVGKLNSASFNGTCDHGKAILKKGTVVSIDFNFQANVKESSLTSVVHGKIGEFPEVKFPLDNPNACKNSGLSCPVPPKKAVDYSPVLRILEAYPKVNVVVKWELQDNSGTDVFCVSIPASIVD